MLSPLTLAGRVISDVGAVVDFVRLAPTRIERALDLAEELAQIGANAAAAADRFDRRFDAMIALGEDLDRRLAELIALGESIRDLGDRFDARGGELVERANRVAETGEELIASLPAFERAVEMATPLEGAIDRFGRFVDLLPGGSAARRRAELAADSASDERQRGEVAAGSGEDTEGDTASESPVAGSDRASDPSSKPASDTAALLAPRPESAPTAARRRARGSSGRTGGSTPRQTDEN